jgi:hypothetical protein
MTEPMIEHTDVTAEDFSDEVSDEALDLVEAFMCAAASISCR